MREEWSQHNSQIRLECINDTLRPPILPSVHTSQHRIINHSPPCRTENTPDDGLAGCQLRRRFDVVAHGKRPIQTNTPARSIDEKKGCQWFSRMNPTPRLRWARRGPFVWALVQTSGEMCTRIPFMNKVPRSRPWVQVSQSSRSRLGVCPSPVNQVPER